MPLHPEPLGRFAVTMADALSAEQCQAIIDVAEGQLQKSGLLGAQRENFRTSSGTWLQEADVPGEIGSIRELVARVTELPVEHQEAVQVLRYLPGQEYKPHQDFWHPDTDYYDAQMARGGQRAWSVMIYLNDVQEGGGTGFPKLGMEVQPRQGKLLAWRNTIEGELNYDSLHAGLPVMAGIKWVAVTWVREAPFF